MRLIIRPISSVRVGSQPQIKEAAFIFGKIHQILLLYSNVLKLNARLDAAFTDCWPFKTVLKWALACGWIRNQSINLQNENRLLKLVELTSNGIWMNFSLFLFFILKLTVFTSNRLRTPHQSLTDLRRFGRDYRQRELSVKYKRR